MQRHKITLEAIVFDEDEKALVLMALRLLRGQTEDAARVAAASAIIDALGAK